MKNRALFEAEIKSQYSKRFQRFGATPKGVFWVSTERQETRFNLILKEIQNFEIPVLKVPSIESLTTGKASIDSLSPIEVEDLLGRGIVSPFKKLLRVIEAPQLWHL